MVEVFVFAGDKAGEGAAYGNIGVCYRNLGDFEKAIEYAKKDLEIAQLTGESRPIRLQHFLSVEVFVFAGNKAGEGSAYCNIGEAKRNLGQFREAIEYQEKYLEIARKTGANRPMRSQHF